MSAYDGFALRGNIAHLPSGGFRRRAIHFSPPAGMFLAEIG